MAITIDSFPTGIAFTKNPLVLGVSSDAYVTTAGVKAKWRITFSSNMGNADTLTISSPIMGGSVVITCNAPADDFGEILPIGSETLAEWIDNTFLPKLREHTKIDEHYEVYRSGNFALLEAKFAGADYNFSTFTASGFTISLLTVTGVDEVVVPDFFFRVRVCMSTNFTSGLYTLKSEWVYFKPSADGSLTVDLSKLADKLLYELDEYSFVLGYGTPSLSQRKMYVQVGEYYGATPEALNTETTSIITVLRGGTSYTNEFISLWGAGLRWLTNRRRISLGVADYDWVYFLYRKAGTTGIKVQVKVYYTDNTETTTTYETDTTSSDYDVKRVPINWTTMGLAALQPTKTAYKYDIWLEYTSGATVSPTITVDICAPVDGQVMYYYYNTFGLIEGLKCTGVRKRESEYKREKTKVRMSTSPDYNEQPEVDFAIERRDYVTLTSYPLAHQDFLAAAELFSSKKAWVYNSQHGDLSILPVNLVPGSIEHAWHGKQGETHKPIEIKAQLPLDENNSTTPWI